MNKEEALKILSAIEAEAAEIKKIIEEKSLPTYKDVIYELHPSWMFTSDGVIFTTTPSSHLYATKKITEREVIRHEWLNIVEYVNRGKVINLPERGLLYYAYVSRDYGTINTAPAIQYVIPGVEYFESEEDCCRAVDMLGEEKFKKMMYERSNF